MEDVKSNPFGRNQHVLDALRRSNDEPIESLLASMTPEQRKLALVMANIVADLGFEVQRLKKSMEAKFVDIENGHKEVSSTVERIPVQLTSDQAAAEYAKCSQKVDFMWSVMLWTGGVLATGAVGLALHFLGFKPLGG